MARPLWGVPFWFAPVFPKLSRVDFYPFARAAQTRRPANFRAGRWLVAGGRIPNFPVGLDRHRAHVDSGR